MVMGCIYGLNLFSVPYGDKTSTCKGLVVTGIETVLKIKKHEKLNQLKSAVNDRDSKQTANEK